MTKLETLTLSANQISNLTPLEGLTNLKDLYITDNQISDITPLEKLTGLEALNLTNNQISNIGSVAKLTGLKALNLVNNKISDVGALENLTSLLFLYLASNEITDYGPLRTLKANNPDVWIDITIPDADAAEAPGQAAPAQTALLSNYPNPFNPETWIPYQLSAAADVSLTIYDIRGVVVRELVLGYQSAGVYYSRARAAHWNGLNNIGEPVASGVYFYTLKAGEFSATRKLLIRK